MAVFEQKMSQHYGQTRDVGQVTWTVSMPQLLSSLKFIRKCVMGYLGLIAISNYNPSMLPLETPCDDSIYAVRQFSYDTFNFQLRETSRLTDELMEGTITEDNAIILMMSTWILYITVGSNCAMSLPLVDFELRRNDFLSFLKAGLQILNMTANFAPNHQLNFFKPINIFEAFPMIPLLKRYYDEFSSLRNLDEGKVNYLLTFIEELNQLFYVSARHNNDAAIFQTIARISPRWYDLIYEQNILALSLLNVWSLICLGFEYYLDRDHNMFADYMCWYRRHCMFNYGAWNFAGDESLYSVMIKKKYLFTTVENAVCFDPIIIDHII